MSRWRPLRPPLQGGRPLFSLAVCALYAICISVAAYFTRFGEVNQDEGWYLYAARLVHEGALPYRDFAFFQAPLLPFVYGLPQALFGAGLEVGRLTSLALTAVAVALAARLAFEGGGRIAALLFLALMSSTPIAMWAFTTTRTEPLSALLLTASAFLLLRRPPRALASSGAVAAAILAAGTRISSLPAAVLVLVWVIVRHRRAPSELAVVLVPGLLVAGGFGWLAVAAGTDTVFFDLVTAQAERHEQLQPAVALSVGGYLTARLRDLHLLHAFYGVVPALSFATACGAAAVWWGQRGDSSTRSGAFVGLAALGVAAYFANFIPRIVFPVYFASVFPLFLILGSWGVGLLFERASLPGRRAIVAAAVVLVLIQVGNFFGRLEAHTRAAESDLDELREVASHLAQVMPMGGTLITIDTYLAVESGRRVPRGWEMGIFSYFPHRSEEDGHRFGILTEGRLAASFESASVAAVALSDRALGVLVERRHSGFRPYQRLSEEELRAALPGLARYRLDRVVPEFGQTRDNLYLLLPERR